MRLLSICRLHLVAWIVGFSFVSEVSAAPEGFQVVSGEASPPALDQNGVLTVHSKDKAIIHWDKFSLDSAEAFRFAQEGVGSSVLNRVVGGDESKIRCSIL